MKQAQGGADRFRPAFFLFLFGGLLLCGGCGNDTYQGECPESATPRECRESLQFRVKRYENAERIYQADAEYQRGYSKGFKEGLAYPGSVK